MTSLTTANAGLCFHVLPEGRAATSCRRATSGASLVLPGVASHSNTANCTTPTADDATANLT